MASLSVMVSNIELEELKMKQSMFQKKKSQVLNRGTYPFFKGPSLADFMFIVVEHFLPNLNHFVAHVFNFRHSLHEETRRLSLCWEITCNVTLQLQIQAEIYNHTGLQNWEDVNTTYMTTTGCKLRDLGQVLGSRTA